MYTINQIIMIIIPSILGFIITYKFNYIQDADSKTARLQELIYFTDNSCYHIHHYIWLIILIILLILARYVVSDNVFFMFVAFTMGCAAEGFLFNDWMLIKNNCHVNKIIDLFKKINDI